MYDPERLTSFDSLLSAESFTSPSDAGQRRTGENTPDEFFLLCVVRHVYCCHSDRVDEWIFK